MTEIVAWIAETPLGYVSIVVALWFLLTVPLMIRVDVGLMIKQVREFARELKTSKSCR